VTDRYNVSYICYALTTTIAGANTHNNMVQ